MYTVTVHGGMHLSKSPKVTFESYDAIIVHTAETNGRLFRDDAHGK